jgi:V/A-type H+-transporting ATPase subunit I
MAIVHMQKVAVLAHRSHKEEVLDALQEMGVLEISEAKAPANLDHTEVNFRVAELQFAIDVLKENAAKETLAVADKPGTTDEVIHAATHTDVRGIVDRLHELEALDTEAQRRIAELTQTQETLRPWASLLDRLDAPTESAKAVRLLGSLSESKMEEFRDALTGSLPRADVQLLDAQNSNAYVSAMVWKSDRAAFEEIATRMGWTTVVLPVLPGTAAVLFEEASVEHKQLEQRLMTNKKERVQLSIELPKLMKVRTFMHWLSDKQSAREAALETFATVTLLGWIPRASVDILETRLQKISKAVAVLKVKADEGEEAPILLKNAKFITPFESVTTLYGFPLPSEMDPTAPLSPFFALYFALCLTDGGYGFALTMIFGLFLLKTRKSVQEAQLPWLLFISGIASILVGIPFGGWFGLTPDQVPSFLTVTHDDGSRWFLGQIWNLSTQTGIDFLRNLALFLGLTHIFFGVFLAGYHKWLHGGKAEAFWQHFTLHIVLGAVIFRVLAPESLVQVATYLMYAAIALVIWGKGYGTVWFLRPIMGVLGLVNFLIGLLSNTLSYLRILALGLVTGAIALAVNQVAIEMSKLFPIWLGIPVMILIAVGGHLVSIALNTLGSFIHSGRLQFIEFFGQFFEGGGRPYTPFKRSIS